MKTVASQHYANESLHESPSPVTHFVQRLTVPSLDSMASSAPGVKEDHHLSAEVLPLFGSDRKVNSVPPPPASFSEYESTKAFDFARLEQSLHHHIDARFERLSRLVVERSDKVVDEVAKMMETFEEKLRKGLRGSIKQDLVALKNEFENLGHDLHGISANSLESKRALQVLNGRVAGLEVSVREAACQCSDPRFRQNALIMSATMPDNPMAHQQIDRQSKLDIDPLTQAPIAQKAFDEALEEIAVDDGHEEPMAGIEPDACDSGEEKPEVPFGIRGVDDGHEELAATIEPDACDPGDEEPSVPLGIRGPNGMLYELPSFLDIDENGDAVVNLPPVEGPMPVPGIRGPNGVLYELPSFMRIGEDGEPEVIPEEDSSTLEANEVASVLGWVEGIDGETDIESAITSMLSCILPSERPE